MCPPTAATGVAVCERGFEPDFESTIEYETDTTWINYDDGEWCVG